MIGFFAPVSSVNQLSAKACFPSRNDPMLLKQPQYRDGLKVTCGGAKLLGWIAKMFEKTEILRPWAQNDTYFVSLHAE
jgi:hypothetical protein